MSIRGLTPSNETIENVRFDERVVIVQKSSARYQVSKPCNNTDTFTYFRGLVVNMVLPGATSFPGVKVLGTRLVLTLTSTSHQLTKTRVTQGALSLFHFVDNSN